MEKFNLISGENSDLIAETEKGKLEIKLTEKEKDSSIEISSDPYGNIELILDGKSEGMVNVTSLLENLSAEERSSLLETWNELEETNWKSFVFLVKIIEKVISR